MSQIIQIIQIRNLSALKDLDHRVGIDHTGHLSEAWNDWLIVTGCWND